jgi:hypothetical protein
MHSLGRAAFLVAVAGLPWARPAFAHDLARAYGAARPSAVALATAPSGDWVRRLKSGDSAQIKGALDDLRMAGPGAGAAVPVIVDLLRQGLSTALTKVALETLGDIESEAASGTVAWYVLHRDVLVRRAATEALAKTRGPVAAKTLRAALSDSDDAVRGLAATGLGKMGVRDAVAELFVALDHHVFEASPSIGELCTGAECERLSDKLGILPFDVVTRGLNEVLLRSSAEVNDDLKVKIVGHVRELGTAEANQFLKGVQAAWPERASRRVKQAIDQAVLATTGSPGADGSETAP